MSKATVDDLLAEMKRNNALLQTAATRLEEANTRLRSVVAGIGILVVVAIALAFFGFKITFH